uniref:Uncharacterized protein n=1 Tax=Salmonella sp. TaxID=599 RepID=A0A482ET99_SALSP|nr:hypothetical protein NNIBIDOC_00097 [Salmonella sp.]
MFAVVIVFIDVKSDTADVFNCVSMASGVIGADIILILSAKTRLASSTPLTASGSSYSDCIPLTSLEIFNCLRDIISLQFPNWRRAYNGNSTLVLLSPDRTLIPVTRFVFIKLTNRLCFQRCQRNFISTALKYCLERPDCLVCALLISLIALCRLKRS